MRSPLACSTAIGLLALAGCGQKGPLYLPDESVQTPVEIRTAPASTPPAATPAGEAVPAPSTAPAGESPPAATATAPEPQAPAKERKPEAAPR